MIIDFIINIVYLIGVLVFVWGLCLFSLLDIVCKGNIVVGVGMVIVIIVVIGQLIEGVFNNYLWIIGVIVIGVIVGLVFVKKVQMIVMF